MQAMSEEFKTQWEEGYDACANGLCDDQNPYKPGTAEYFAWKYGYESCENFD